jgi:hypothetical protein
MAAAAVVVAAAAAGGAEGMGTMMPTVIGHGIGGKYIPINMARLAESQSLE